MMIQLKGLHKTYKGAQPLHVLKGIDLNIEEGEFVAIMGASGSGKSTLLNILGILDDYDEGEYTLNGTLIKNLSETKAAGYRNRMIGFVFQSFNLIPYKDALWNILTRWDFAIGHIICPTRCQAVRNSVSPLHEHSSPTHKSSLPMSQQVPSTARPLWR